MNKLLDNLKNDFQDTPVSRDFMDQGWSNLEKRITGEERFRQIRSLTVVLFAVVMIGGGIR